MEIAPQLKKEKTSKHPKKLNKKPNKVIINQAEDDNIAINKRYKQPTGRREDQIILTKKLMDISQDDTISIVISSNVSSNVSSNGSLGHSPHLSANVSTDTASHESCIVELSSGEMSQDAEVFQENDFDSSKPYQEQTDKGIIIKKFYDYRPQAHHNYFTPPQWYLSTVESKQITPSVKRGIAVVIPFFNEESYELQQTLNSLYLGYLELRKLSKKWADEPLSICLIQDGWQKASKSMKTYLKYMFPKKIKGKGWWNYFPELSNNAHLDPHLNMNATFIIERDNDVPSLINPQLELINEQRFMKITLIIKANNRRKHNSHEWFLSETTGYAETSRAKYLFLTDAFTLYSEKCLYYLVNDLDQNNHLSGVTGRQRLMTRDQQGSGESIFSFGYILRMIELYDFEYANSGYNGAFSLGGLLPVIPGPCGLYRASDILQNNVRNSYFNVVNKEPSETGLIEGNLRIAEDRILTYYAVTKTKEEKYLAFNPLAVFYFEAETDLQKLMFQRRRWINGSVAGYIYLLFVNFADFKEWNVGMIRKIYVWLLLMSQLIIYAMVGIAPAISMRILYYGIDYFLSYYNAQSFLAMILLFCGIWLLYVAHLFIHHNQKFNYLIMYILVPFSLITSLILWGSLFHSVFIATEEPIIQQLQHAHPVVYMAIAVFIGQFVSSLCLTGRGHGFLYMVKSFIPYLLFIPLLIAWIGAYSYSRTWDLSWGNRPATELNDISIEQKDIMITKFKEKSLYIIFALIILNTPVFFIPLIGQLYLMGIFFTVALYQMLLSIIYCFTKINYKLQMIRKSSKRRYKQNPNSEI